MPLDTLFSVVKYHEFPDVVIFSLSDTNHVEVFLIEAAEDEEDVSTQLTEKPLRTHVFREPLDDVTLRQKVPPTKQVLQGDDPNHIIR